MRVEVKDPFNFTSLQELTMHYARIQRRIRNAKPRAIERPAVEQEQEQEPEPEKARSTRARMVERPVELFVDDESPPIVVEVPIISEDVEESVRLQLTARLLIPLAYRGAVQSTIIITSHMSGIPAAILNADIRTAHVVYWRQLGQYVARKCLGYSLVTIGRRWGGKDHTSILNSYKCVERKLASQNPETRRKMSRDFFAFRGLLFLSMTEHQLNEAQERCSRCDSFSITRRRRILNRSVSSDGPNTISPLACG